MSWYRSFRAGPDRSSRTKDADDTGGGLADIPFTPDWRLFIAIMGIFGSGVLFARWRQKQRRQNRAGRSLDPDRDRAVRLYLQLESNLRKAGQERPSDVTPREHADALSRSGFLAATEVSEITDAYLATRFGDDRLPPAEYHRLKQLSRNVRARETRRPTA